MSKTKRPSMRKCAYKHCPHPSFVPRRSDQIFCSKRCAHLASDERTGRKNHQKRKVVQPELTPVEEAHGLLHGQMTELKIDKRTVGLRETAALSLAFHLNRDYLERRITALNRRACLHEGEHCGIRARQEITGMLCVLNALGYEAVGDWTRYDGEFKLVRAEDLVEKKEGGAK